MRSLYANAEPGAGQILVTKHPQKLSKMYYVSDGDALLLVFHTKEIRIGVILRLGNLH